MNKNLLQDAIADAKSVREAALANAKIALEEALTPKLQSMISAKLQEIEDEGEVEEGFQPEKTGDFIQDEETRKHHIAEEDDFDLSEILAELEDDDSDDTDEVDEAKKKKDDKKSKPKEDEPDEDDEPAGEEPDEDDEPIDDKPIEGGEGEEGIDDEKISDLTVAELRDIIRDVISSEVGGGSMGGDESGMDDMNMDMDNGGEAPMGGEDHNPGSDDEDVDLDELLAELEALEEGEEDELDEAKKKKDELDEAKKKKDDKKDDKKKKDELKEALETIKVLRTELNENNLLNAKLLFVNKIFSKKTLTESQKLKVINSFDKATNPKQAKELYESIMKNSKFGGKKSMVKESLGFASKAAGVAPKKPIIDSNDQFARWQKLANIK